MGLYFVTLLKIAIKGIGHFSTIILLRCHLMATHLRCDKLVVEYLHLYF